jgi:membrane protease YdiL (CAAX protease family)
MREGFRKALLAAGPLILIPIGWGILNFIIHRNTSPGPFLVFRTSAPGWVFAWLGALTCLLPFWVWLARNNYQRVLVDRFRFLGVTVRTGSMTFYLSIAYLAAFSAVWFPDGWYGRYFVFGGVVSPIIEEFFTRYLLSPFLGSSKKIFFLMAATSSAAFAAMHWGFDAGAFDLGAQGQLTKFLSHFLFGMALTVLFRWFRCIGPIIWVHMIMNLEFLVGLT